MDLDADGKITFREFSHGITPEYPQGPCTDTSTLENGGGLLNPEFNVEWKEEVRRTYEEQKHNAINERKTSASPLRDYRTIYNSNAQISPIKREFQDLKLKQTIEPDNQYIVDLIKVGSPIGKVVRTELDPNLRSPIRPYGDASFLSLRDQFFSDGFQHTSINNNGNGAGTYDQLNTIGGRGVIQEHPTIMTSQPEIFNRNEDEEIDDEDDSRYNQYQYNFRNN